MINSNDQNKHVRVSVSLSSVYKVYGISNVHVKSTYFAVYKVLKCLEIQSNVHLPTISSSCKNKSKHSCTVCM